MPAIARVRTFLIEYAIALIKCHGMLAILMNTSFPPTDSFARFLRTLEQTLYPIVAVISIKIRFAASASIGEIAASKLARVMNTAAATRPRNKYLFTFGCGFSSNSGGSAILVACSEFVICSGSVTCSGSIACSNPFAYTLVVDVLVASSKDVGSGSIKSDSVAVSYTHLTLPTTERV